MVSSHDTGCSDQRGSLVLEKSLYVTIKGGKIITTEIRSFYSRICAVLYPHQGQGLVIAESLILASITETVTEYFLLSFIEIVYRHLKENVRYLGYANLQRVSKSGILFTIGLQTTVVKPTPKYKP